LSPGFLYLFRRIIMFISLIISLGLSNDVPALASHDIPHAEGDHCSAASGPCGNSNAVKDPAQMLHKAPKGTIGKAETATRAVQGSRSSMEFHACSFTELTSSGKSKSEPLRFALFNVIELCLTDHLNRRTGYDYSTQKMVGDIPDSCFSGHDGRPDAHFRPNAYQQMTLNSMASTNYKLQVVGTKVGGYIVECHLHENYLNTKTFSVERITFPGAVHEYEIVVDYTLINCSKMTKRVSSGEIGGSLQTAFHLNWIDNQELLNSLTKNIENAESAIKGGQIDTAIDKLGALINKVQAQKGKHIVKKAADVLIDDARSYIDQIKAIK
jgi:hypothetical protein